MIQCDHSNETTFKYWSGRILINSSFLVFANYDRFKLRLKLTQEIKKRSEFAAFVRFCGLVHVAATNTGLDDSRAHFSQD